MTRTPFFVCALLLIATGCSTGNVWRNPSTPADVGFASGFGSSAWFVAWGWRKPPQRTEVVWADPSLEFEPHEGGALKITLEKGQHGGPEGLRINLASVFGEEPEEVYTRFYLRLADDWTPVSSGKLPGIAGTYDKAGFGGRLADGRNGWSARSYFGATKNDRNIYGFYVYHADMKGPYGDAWPWPDVKLERNRWYRIEQYVKLNTPGKRDGILRGWLDGRLAFEKTDLRFRDIRDLRVETFWLDVYHGGPQTAVKNHSLYLDDVAVGRTRIGTTPTLSR